MHFFLKILQMHLKICLQLHICKSFFVFKAVRPHSEETYLGNICGSQNHVHTGGAVVVHQFCHIGSFAFVAGGSVVKFSH